LEQLRVLSRKKLGKGVRKKSQPLTINAPRDKGAKHEGANMKHRGKNQRKDRLPPLVWPSAEGGLKQ